MQPCGRFLWFFGGEELYTFYSVENEETLRFQNADVECITIYTHTYTHTHEYIGNCMVACVCL